ncbi:hypothetical protein ACHAXS_008757 [Conticribra weissflogii]
MMHSPLNEIAAECSSPCQKTTTSSPHTSFDARLRAKLGPTSSSSCDYNNDRTSSTADRVVQSEGYSIDGFRSKPCPSTAAEETTREDHHFEAVRALFRNAAVALQLELRHQSGIVGPPDSDNDESDHDIDQGASRTPQMPQPAPYQSPSSNDPLAMAHWIPGRIEVMGKHTDYAGGNSLVCATAGRGMAMVSTLISTHDYDHENERCNATSNNTRSKSYNEIEGSETKVTIVSVLPPGMESRAAENKNTLAPFSVNGRPVVHHTIRLPMKTVDGKDVVSKKISQSTNSTEVESEPNSVDWTIYPTAVVHRLHHNFGLLPHYASDDDEEINDGNHNERNQHPKSIHIIISISSNLPPASGLSTSSAFVTGIFLVLDSHLGLHHTESYRRAIGVRRTENDNLPVYDKDGCDELYGEDEVYNLSTYLGNVENGQDYVVIGRQSQNQKPIVLKGTAGVGTFGGSEDHAAILMGKRGQLRLLSFCPTRPASFRFREIDVDIGDVSVTSCEVDEVDGSYDSMYQGSVVRMPPDLAFVVAYSGAKAEKAGGVDGATAASEGYNNASELARKALDAYVLGGENDTDDTLEMKTLAEAVRWERRRLGIQSTSWIGILQQKDQIKKFISDRILSRGSTAKVEQGMEASNSTATYQAILAKRFEQFFDESEFLVPTAAYALENEKYEMLGSIVEKSHQGAVNILRNQIEETAWLPLSARGMEHRFSESSRRHNSSEPPLPSSTPIKALAASAFGAGFGGSCWALVHRTQARDFARQWLKSFNDAFPLGGNGLDREFFVTEPGPGAFCV